MRPYGEFNGMALLRACIRGSRLPARYRRTKRKAERAAEHRQPRKAERRRVQRELVAVACERDTEVRS